MEVILKDFCSQQVVGGEQLVLQPPVLEVEEAEQHHHLTPGIYNV